ncbi:MAG: carboxymuconolactone decarboxylase family protein [Rhodospirillaceae bacterium]|nr:carboxymuconolactone decarboxylase family protein [Rhodospirillaceae bacterium]
MPRIHPVNRESATSPVAETLDAVKSKLGRVPNILGTLANSNAALQAYLGLSDILGKGRLSPKQREAIALTIAQANGCKYCLSAHTAIGQSVGLSHPEILAARSGSSDDAQTNAIIKLTAKIVTERGWLIDDDLAAARKQGVDDGLIVEIVANVAHNTLTNYTNHIAETVVDFPIAQDL